MIISITGVGRDFRTFRGGKDGHLYAKDADALRFLKENARISPFRECIFPLQIAHCSDRIAFQPLQVAWKISRRLCAGEAANTKAELFRLGSYPFFEIIRQHGWDYSKSRQSSTCQPTQILSRITTPSLSTSSQ